MINCIYRIKQAAPAHTAGSDRTFSQHEDREAAIHAAETLSAIHEDIYVECRLYADSLQLKQDKPFDTDIVWASWL